MRNVLIIGAGNIGSLAACLLANTCDYQVYLVDKEQPVLQVDCPLDNLKLFQLDIANVPAFSKFIQENQIQVLISCLPYYFSETAATYAKQYGLHYFDLTEDVHVAEAVKVMAEGANNIFMPRCGLAPGFVNILANDMIQDFDQVESVELRVGDLPININNALQYALSWSTDGLINEYGNVCYGLINGHKMQLEPLEDLEVVEIDGLTYEAFNTSGGIGSLADTYAGKITNMNYKTLRYPGHCAHMRFLMKDLQLNTDRETLKRVLEKALPKTCQDVALIYVAVTGTRSAHLITETYASKIYPRRFLDRHWSAIQATTASGLCATVDVVLGKGQHFSGLVLQEQLSLQEVLDNRFGKIFIRQDPAAKIATL